jgi:hypothetical protein
MRHTVIATAKTKDQSTILLTEEINANLLQTSLIKVTLIISTILVYRATKIQIQNNDIHRCLACIHKQFRVAESFYRKQQ